MSAVYAAPLPFRWAISLAGVVDLRQAWELGLSDRAVVRLLDGTPCEPPAHYAATSPADLLPLGVPQLLAHGNNDEIVPPGMSEANYTRAIALGGPATLARLRETGHFERIDPASAAWPRLADAIERFARHSTAQ